MTINRNSSHNSSLLASFSLDPYELLKLAGSRISATENPMPRWAVAEEVGPGKVRLIERTVQLALGCYRTSMVDRCLCMEHRANVISLTCPSQSTSYHWCILNGCLLCVTIFKRLRLSCESPISQSSWGATAKRISRQLTNILCRSLGIRTQKCRDRENTD